jgi:hypothetical protein
MGLYELYDHTRLQADKQYTVYGIVYEVIPEELRTNPSTLRGVTCLGVAIEYEVGKTYSAKSGVTLVAGRRHPTYPAGFHRFLSLDDVRQFYEFERGSLSSQDADLSDGAVIAEFTVFGKDVIAQGYYKQHDPRLPTTVWSKVTYVGCFDVRSRTCQKLSFVPVASLDTPQPTELVEADQSPKDFSIAQELAYLNSGKDI